MGMIGNMFLRFRLRRKAQPQPPTVFSHKGRTPRPKLRTRRGLETAGPSVSLAEIRAESEYERHERERLAKRIGRHKPMPWERRQR